MVEADRSPLAALAMQSPNWCVVTSVVRRMRCAWIGVASQTMPLRFLPVVAGSASLTVLPCSMTSSIDPSYSSACPRPIGKVGPARRLRSATRNPRSTSSVRLAINTLELIATSQSTRSKSAGYQVFSPSATRLTRYQRVPSIHRKRHCQGPPARPSL